MDRIGTQLEKPGAVRERDKKLLMIAHEGSQQNMTSRAIKVLEDGYDGRLSEDAMQFGIELFTNTAKADVLFVLGSGDGMYLYMVPATNLLIHSDREPRNPQTTVYIRYRSCFDFPSVACEHNSIFSTFLELLISSPLSLY